MKIVIIGVRAFNQNMIIHRNLEKKLIHVLNIIYYRKINS